MTLPVAFGQLARTGILIGLLNSGSGVFKPVVDVDSEVKVNGSSANVTGIRFENRAWTTWNSRGR